MVKLQGTLIRKATRFTLATQLAQSKHAIRQITLLPFSSPATHKLAIACVLLLSFNRIS